VSALKWANCLAWALDALALTALAATGEVQLPFFAGVGFALLISRIPRVRVRISERIQFGTLLIGVLAAVAVWYHWRLAPVVIAAHAAPIIHALLWFTPNTGRNRAWRLGIGFIELTLASALTVELYLSVAIFAFVVVAAVKLSCEFLDVELTSAGGEPGRGELPVSFIRSTLSTAFLIFLSAACIFPILPRLKSNGGTGGSDNSARIGYTEDVSLSEGVSLSTAGGSTIVLWLYPRNEQSLDGLIFKNLIRVKELSVFDGKHWSPGLVMSGPRKTEIPGPSGGPDSGIRPVAIDAVRDPIGTFNLPLPYGAEHPRQTREDLSERFQKLSTGEWFDRAASSDQIMYTFDMYPYDKARSRRLLDEPVPANLEVPAALKTARLERLERHIFGDARDAREKVSRLQQFFRVEKFKPSERGLVNEEALGNPIAARMHPLERFLFVSREGHCEWFATATAMLLRMAGVPTRLVTGFRVTQPTVEGSVRVRAADAHAWVEIWQPESGWAPFDPTPRILWIPGVGAYLRDGYDLLSGYWYRYILSFKDAAWKGSVGPNPQTAAADEDLDSGLKAFERRVREAFAQNLNRVLIVVLGLASLIVGILLLIRWWAPWVFSIRYRVREGRPAIKRERLRLERVLRGHGAILDAKDDGIRSVLPILRGRGCGASEVALERWLRSYERVRFGAVAGNEGRRLRQLALRRKMLVHTLHKERARLSARTGRVAELRP
jgi:transglutaminase-like putative cysteine protease